MQNVTNTNCTLQNVAYIHYSCYLCKMLPLLNVTCTICTQEMLLFENVLNLMLLGHIKPPGVNGANFSTLYVGQIIEIFNFLI